MAASYSGVAAPTARSPLYVGGVLRELVTAPAISTQVGRSAGSASRAPVLEHPRWTCAPTDGRSWRLSTIGPADAARSRDAIPSARRCAGSDGPMSIARTARWWRPSGEPAAVPWPPPCSSRAGSGGWRRGRIGPAAGGPGRRTGCSRSGPAMPADAGGLLRLLEVAGGAKNLGARSSGSCGSGLHGRRHHKLVRRYWGEPAMRHLGSGAPSCSRPSPAHPRNPDDAPRRLSRTAEAGGGQAGAW